MLTTLSYSLGAFLITSGLMLIHPGLGFIFAGIVIIALFAKN